MLATHGARARVQVVYDRAFFDALTTENKTFEPLCPYERYKAILSQADIALMPLEPTRFNQHKSDLKFIEAAAHGAAVLASPTVYERTIRHGETGLIYRSIDEFAALLDRLIRDATFRRRLIDGACRYVAENRLLAAMSTPDTTGTERCSTAGNSLMPSFVSAYRSWPDPDRGRAMLETIEAVRGVSVLNCSSHCDGIQGRIDRATQSTP